jgi:acyl dehydratase
MAVPNRFILHQVPVIAAIGKSVVNALVNKGKGGAVQTPGPEIHRTFEPRSRDLVRCYVKTVGGDPSAYKRTLPPHLFPQWGFPLATEVLSGIDYPIQRVLNAGCRMEIHGPLPNDEKLEVRARLEDIDDNGRRALIKTRIVTGTKSSPDALVGHMFALIPLGGGGDKSKKKKERPRVPEDARELRFFELGASAGLEYAKLTGDFNPIHWVPAYARASGFRSCILHGFATMSHAMEGLHRSLLSGDVNAIRMLDVQFTSPLLLPARVGLYVKNHDIYVGDAAGGRAYLTGKFATRDSNGENS